MQKVNNITNHRLLDSLSNNVVQPLLVLLVTAKSTGSSVSTLTVGLPLALVAALNCKLSKSETLATYCENVVRSTTLIDLKNVLNSYDHQSNLLDSYNYSVISVGVPKQIKNLFVNVLYKKLFDQVDIWKALGLPTLTREKFHENFRQDNMYPSTCPYCDLDTMNSAGTRIVEHFLPKAKYPLLALHPCNLFTACNGCNSPAAKGSKVSKTVTSPYAHEIGTRVVFDFENLKRVLGISSRPNDREVEGYLSLMRLPKRYAERGTWEQFDGRRLALIESLQGKSHLDKSTFMAYIARQQKGAVLTFAISHWALNDYWPINYPSPSP